MRSPDSVARGGNRPDNARSISLVEKFGFRYEGRLRYYVLANGAWRDSLLYSLLLASDRDRRKYPGLTHHNTNHALVID
jgi:hypothetical protein